MITEYMIYIVLYMLITTLIIFLMVRTNNNLIALIISLTNTFVVIESNSGFEEFAIVPIMFLIVQYLLLVFSSSK